MLRFSLWGPVIFPESAFDNLKSRYPDKNLESLLGIKAKLPEDLQVSAAGASGSKAFEPAQKNRN